MSYWYKTRNYFWTDRFMLAREFEILCLKRISIQFPDELWDYFDGIIMFASLLLIFYIHCPQASSISSSAVLNRSTTSCCPVLNVYNYPVAELPSCSNSESVQACVFFRLSRNYEWWKIWSKLTWTFNSSFWSLPSALLSLSNFHLQTISGKVISLWTF